MIFLSYPPWRSCIYTYLFTLCIHSQPNHVLLLYIVLHLNLHLLYFKLHSFDSLPSCFPFTRPFEVPMPPKDPSCVYVGRPSVWGNPYTVKQYGRRIAIEKFEVHLLESGLINRIHELCGKRLYCHCFPLSCHASVLIKYAHELKIDISE